MPGWAFRFLQGVPGVTMVLSGMSSLEQLRANLDTFETDRPLSEAEKAALLDVAAGMVREQVLPCTACRYCVDHCPRHLDIPGLLALYNEHTFTGGGFIAPMAVEALPEEKRPAACIGCRSCEAVCPQQLKISEALADFARKLGEIPGAGVAIHCGLGYHKGTDHDTRWIHQGGRRHAPDPGGRLPLQRRTDFHPHAGGR